MDKIIDTRGKAMVAGGRYRVAQHLRWLRKVAGNSAARFALRNAQREYARAFERQAMLDNG